MQSFNPSETMAYVSYGYPSQYPKAVPTIVTLIHPSDITHNITSEKLSEHQTAASSLVPI